MTEDKTCLVTSEIQVSLNTPLKQEQAQNPVVLVGGSRLVSENRQETFALVPHTQQVLDVVMQNTRK